MSDIVRNYMGIEFDIDDISSDLNMKLDTDLTNLQSVSEAAKAILKAAGVIFLTESWSSGTEFYRVYSDGFCIQGGQHDRGQDVTVNLHKPLNDINYTVELTGLASSQAYAPLVRGSSRTTQSFHVFSAGNGSHQGMWIAYGYVA